MRFHYFIALVFILQYLYLQERRRKEIEVIKQKEGCAENVNGARLSRTNLIILIQAQIFRLVAAARCGSAVVCWWRSQSARWELMSSMSWLNSPLNSTALTTIINEACYKLKIT